MGFSQQEHEKKIMTGVSEFVALDISSLSVIANNKSTFSPRFIQSVPRKGSPRLGERKIPPSMEVDATVGGPAASPKSAITVHVAGSDMPVNTGKYRRLGSRGRSTPGLDPRRVLFLFATLSSMGTLILLYFTFSMGKMPGSDANVG